MCSRADQVQVVPIDLVEQEPVRFDATVSMTFPVPTERVVLITRRLGIALYQEKNQFAELGELLASAFGQLHTALELGAANQIAHA
jgi:hypothetical protein